MSKPRSLALHLVKAVLRHFVMRLVMHTILDVLESQGRSAFLPDAVISGILGQLKVRITYVSLQCQMFIPDPTKDGLAGVDSKCIIVGSTVTGICAKMMEEECVTRQGPTWWR
ncbi:hypothetical protein KIN20_019470 [Parelaphostrongylus tenuis]|uniref:Uncharacterized protein n=1 Tax=Parelaphostrongylus tenuis TaxID=148309 RepID=A0AAD5N5J9_PARTN|nr:hypothetical protein KIN20_019470 [Parelaphostrongylus tenuis]